MVLPISSSRSAREYMCGYVNVASAQGVHPHAEVCCFSGSMDKDQTKIEHRMVSNMQLQSTKWSHDQFTFAPYFACIEHGKQNRM